MDAAAADWFHVAQPVFSPIRARVTTGGPRDAVPCNTHLFLAGGGG